MREKLKQLLLLTGKQMGGYVVLALSTLFDYPALFINFYFTFYFTGSFTETGLSILVWMAILSACVAFIMRILKIQAMKYKTPVIGAIPRAVLQNKFLIGLAVVYTTFQIKFPPAQVLTFVWISVATRIASKMLYGVSLKLFDLDWSDE